MDNFRDDIYNAVKSRMETMRHSGFSPDDHVPVSILTDYILGLLGNEEVRKEFEGYRNTKP